jgi:hypothetical protein
MPYTLGRYLKVGDTIEVWWYPKRDRITDLAPHSGQNAYIFEPGGAQFIIFEVNQEGISMGNNDHFWVMEHPA